MCSLFQSLNVDVKVIVRMKAFHSAVAQHVLVSAKIGKKRFNPIKWPIALKLTIVHDFFISECNEDYDCIAKYENAYCVDESFCVGKTFVTHIFH